MSGTREVEKHRTALLEHKTRRRTRIVQPDTDFDDGMTLLSKALRRAGYTELE